MTGENTNSDTPSASRSILLSGFGYYKLSVRRRKVLTYVFAGSLAAHIVALAIFGGWIVMRSKPEEVAIFKTPPPARKYEPRKLEHRVKVQKRQRSSSRPSMMPRLVSMKVSDLSLPEIKVDPKIIHTTFQPKFKAVSGKGLGAGLGTGYGTHGFGAGVSSVNFFGIQARGEKIAILVDVSVSMVEEERGGVAGYMSVKQRVEQVVDAISEGGMFNLMVFADAASAMEKQVVMANNDNKKKAKLYLRPFNTEGNWGLTQGNVKASKLGLKAHGGTTRLDLALTAAFEQGADTVLVISDGIPRVQKGFTADQLRAWQAREGGWWDENADRVAEWDRRQAAWVGGGGGGGASKVWVPPVPAQKGPPKEGQTARAAQPGYWKVVGHGGHWHGWYPRPAAPKRPDPGFWTLTDFLQHLKILHEELYLKKGKKPPVIHCIGYQIDKKGHAFLQGLARAYHGQYRRVRRLKK